jgi:hypothetical protein
MTWESLTLSLVLLALGTRFVSPRSRWFEDRLRPCGAKPVSDALCPLREPIGHRTGSSAGIVAGSAGCHTRSLHSDGGASKRSYALGGASWWFKPQGPFIPMPRTIPQSADGQVATAHNGRRLCFPQHSVISGLENQTAGVDIRAV